MWPLFRTRPASFEIINALADGYTPSTDRLTHKVTLRSDIKFHDGSPIDATSVAANLNAAFNQTDPLRGPGAYQAITTFFGGFPGNFKSVEVNDPRTLTISLNSPRADLRGALCYIYMVNRKVMQANAQAYGTDVALLKNAGSGPFRIADFQPGQFVEFTRFDGFVEEAYVDKLPAAGGARRGPPAVSTVRDAATAHAHRHAPLRQWRGPAALHHGLARATNGATASATLFALAPLTLLSRRIPHRRND
jgi:ABC-type transport system substrate-binding protein